MNKPTDPTAIEPPDDSGSEAFLRFVYQAEIAIPICVNCALGGKTLSLVTEHIEDLAIEEEDHWQVPIPHGTVEDVTDDEHD